MICMGERNLKYVTHCYLLSVSLSCWYFFAVPQSNWQPFSTYDDPSSTLLSGGGNVHIDHHTTSADIAHNSMELPVGGGGSGYHGFNAVDSGHVMLPDMYHQFDPMMDPTAMQHMLQTVEYLCQILINQVYLLQKNTAALCLNLILNLDLKLHHFSAVSWRSWPLATLAVETLFRRHSNSSPTAPGVLPIARWVQLAF